MKAADWITDSWPSTPSRPHDVSGNQQARDQGHLRMIEIQRMPAENPERKFAMCPVEICFALSERFRRTPGEHPRIANKYNYLPSVELVASVPSAKRWNSFPV